jgi:hypothetical protein
MVTAWWQSGVWFAKTMNPEWINLNDKMTGDSIQDSIDSNWLQDIVAATKQIPTCAGIQVG